MDSIADRISRRIVDGRRGWVFTPRDFLDLGSRASVDQVLSRLVRQGKVRRLDRGLYDYPRMHDVLGVLAPDSDGIARALAAQRGNVIFPSGAVAANLLGLSTQVPARLVYMTNGVSQTKTVGGRTITFKHARVPILSHQSDSVNYVLQALSYLGKDGINEETVQRCASYLDRQDIDALGQVFPEVSAWMGNTIRRIRDTYHANLCQAN